MNECHIDRMSFRQLRDIRQKIYLTELASSDVEGVQGQLHHARCIYNALSDIKPEVENVIKLGRKIVDSGEDGSSTEGLTAKIDSLKADFNEVGAQITETKKVLEKALTMAETLQDHLAAVQDWFGATDTELAAKSSLVVSGSDEVKFLRTKHEEMAAMKERIKAIQSLQEEFFEMGDPKLLTGLKEYVRAVESRWSRTVARLQKRLAKAREEVGLVVDVPDFDLLKLSASRERTLSSGQDAEDPMMTEFRSVFRDVSTFIKTAEDMLDAKTEAKDRELGEKVEVWKRKNDNLVQLSKKIVEKFQCQKDDVEPGTCESVTSARINYGCLQACVGLTSSLSFLEMSSLGRRWDYVAGQVGKRLAEHRRKAAMAAPVTATATSATSRIPKPKATGKATSSVTAKERFFAASPPTQPKFSPRPGSKMSAKERFFASGPPSSVAQHDDALASKKSTRVTNLDDEDVIDTLPEDNSSPPEKRRLPAELDLCERQSGKVSNTAGGGGGGDLGADSLLSSKDSSICGSAADLEVVTGQVILQSNSPTFIKETVSIIPRKGNAPPKNLPNALTSSSSPTDVPNPTSLSPVKTPPKTLPKPTWFTLEPPATNSSSTASASTSSSKTSSSQMKAVIGKNPTKDLDISKRNFGEHGGTTGTESELSEDALLANENSAIERILKEANADLQEVVGKRKANSQYKFHGKKATAPSATAAAEERNGRECKEFEENAAAMLRKIETAKSKLDQLDKESDLKLRQDLIGMEYKVIEADVATLISRGDTLVLLVHRHSVPKANDLQEKVTQLRAAWHGLKTAVDRKRETTNRSEESVKKFIFEVDRLKIWMAEMILKMDDVDFTGVTDDAVKMRQFALEIERRTVDVQRLAETAHRLKEQHALGNQADVWHNLYCQWEELVGKAKNYYRTRIERNLVTSPTRSTATMLSGLDVDDISHFGPDGRAGAKEIMSRIASMRDAVVAIKEQFKTQVLINSKQYENLEEQREALATVNGALERLRPTIKKTAKDLEVMTGSLSVEFLEKIVSMSEKLRDEWQEINRRYKERHSLWKKCNEKRARYAKLQSELNDWLDEAERTLAHANATAAAAGNKSKLTEALEEQKQIERQVSERNKEVTDLAVIGKEIMNRTSAQEHVDIQAEVDRILKRWKAVLSQLSSQRERFNKERLLNNLTYMNQWVDDATTSLAESVNPSDSSAINRVLNVLIDYEDQLKEKSVQMEKLKSGRGSGESVEKLNSKFNKLTICLHKRRKELEENSKRLDSIVSRIATADVWVTHSLTQLDDWRGNSDKMSQLRASIREKEAELVGKLFQDYELLSRETSSTKQQMDSDLEAQMNQLQSNWQRLVSESRKVAIAKEEARITKLRSSSSSAAAVTKSPPLGRKAVSASMSVPELFSVLREHRDWVRMKRGLLQALVLAGSVGSLQRQSDEHQDLK